MQDLDETPNLQLVYLFKTRWLKSILISTVLFIALYFICTFLNDPVDIQSVVICYIFLFIYLAFKPKILFIIKNLLV